MAKRKVLEHGPLRQRTFTVDDEATKGAILGVNLYWPDGTLVEYGDLVPSAVTPTTPPGVLEYVRVLWSFILDIPTNIRNLAALAGVGFSARITEGGEWATRVFRGTEGRVIVHNGDGVATDAVLGTMGGYLFGLMQGGLLALEDGTGDPRVDLQTVIHQEGGRFQVFESDPWGRVVFHRPGTQADLPAWPLVKEVIDEWTTDGDLNVVEIPDEYQLIVYNSMDVRGTLNVEGTLVVL